MEKFCADLKKACNRNINYVKKEILPEKGNTAIDEEIDKEIESYNNQNFCHICKKSFMILMKTMIIATVMVTW